MKKNQVNSMFNEDTKRKHVIVTYIVIISCIFIIFLVSLFIYISKYQVQYAKYSENSNVDYEVYYKKNNEFFEDEKIGENGQYISELIDYIKANFSYNLSLKEKEVSYQYKYRIEANVIVSDKTTKRTLYKYDDVLLDNKEVQTSENSANIEETVNINYNKYNDLILDFVNSYNLDDAVSTLYVNLYVDVVGSCDNVDYESSNESVTTLEIPLTNRTMAIDITDNLVNNEDNVMICSEPLPINILYVIISLVSLVVDVILVIYLIIYIRNTRSAKTIYELELKRILNNYRSYIQKVNTKFNLKEYQVLKIDNFTDMLEIRDTTNQPILMVENGEKNSAYFIIPTSTKILYTYCIKVCNIQKELDENNVR